MLRALSLALTLLAISSHANASRDLWYINGYGTCNTQTTTHCASSEQALLDIICFGNPCGERQERIQNGQVQYTSSATSQTWITYSTTGVIVNGCPVGTYFNDVTRACEIDETFEPPPPPSGPCQEQGYPEGWIEQPFTVGTETQIHCTQVFGDGDQQDCEQPLGTIEGLKKSGDGYSYQTQVVCNDHAAECTNGGGSWGMVNGQAMCIPGDYADDLPTCDSNGRVNLIENEAGEGGYVCESPVNQPNDIPGNEPTPEPDTDGDGIPDSEDPDIDNDGTPNGSDNDTDGDGIPNADDPTPNGPEASDPTVEGGQSCTVRPSCTGDAIQCAILYQLWKTRCDAEVPGEDDISESIDAPETGELFGTNDLTSELGDVFSPTGETAACPAADSITVAGSVFTIEYTEFCNIANLVRPIVLLLFGLISLRIVMRAF